MKLKDKPLRSLTQVLDDAVSSLGRVVDQRWWVEEIEPGKDDWYDGWSRGYPDEVIERSVYFSSLGEANQFIQKHEPSKPENRLAVRTQKCYERLERRWL